MRDTRAAKRYAKALFEMALERGIEREIYDDLQAALARLESMPPVKSYVEQPFVPAAAKRRAIEVALNGVVSDAALDFLRVLVARDRADQLDAITVEYWRLWLAQQGIETARVTSAVPLKPEETAELLRSLSRVTGSRVQIEATVDPGIIGGVIAIVGDRVWDGSVRGSLSRLRAEMKAQDVVGRLRASRG